MSKTSKLGDPKDIEEFGDAEFGTPTISQLIKCLPEDKKEEYRETIRNFIKEVNKLTGRNCKTYAEYMRDYK